MREIKFRAWYRYKKINMYNIQNAYDCLTGRVQDKFGNDIEYFEQCFDDFLDNEQYIVEQYTGIKDENGVEIYEHDVLWTGVDYVYISFKYGSFVIVSDIEDDVALNEYPIDEWTISGNIHENADLLEWNDDI